MNAPYQVMPDLPEDEYAALKADIAENGVLVPVEKDENGVLLDGHHRVRAWEELCAEGQELPAYPVLIRYGMSDAEKRNHARRLNVMRRQLDKAGRDRVIVSMRADGMTYAEIGDAVGVDPKTAQRAVMANAKTDQPTTVTGKDGKQYPASKPRSEAPMSLFVPGHTVALDPKAAEQTVKVIREERRVALRQDRVDRINEIAKGSAPLSAPQCYPVIYADPPWRYEHSKTVNREIENQYPTMSLDEICDLPVAEIAAPHAILYLWTTSPKLAESMRVIEAWGFVYRTCMVWVKDKFGMGYYARQRHELLLIAKRGDFPVPEADDRFDSVIEAPRGEHSAKPEIVYDMLEQMHPEFDKLELFARGAREGWSRWGNQA